MIKKLLSHFLFIVSCLVITSLNYSCQKENTVIPEDPITSDPTVYDEEPSWSNNGISIAYVGKDSSNTFKVLAIDTNSANKRTLTSVSAESPIWSKDNEWVIYEKNGNIFKKRIFKDTVTIQLTFSGNCFYPTLSKDGEWIAFDSNIENPENIYCIWKMKIDGSQKKRIIYEPSQGEVRQPDWFPDGKRLVVTRYLLGHGGAREIAIIDTSGNSLSTLTNNTEIERNPRVSPNGQYITFWKDLKIFRIKSDGSDLMQLATNGINPNWSPDGQKIVYTNVTTGDGRIWIMNLDGSNRIKITF